MAQRQQKLQSIPAPNNFVELLLVQNVLELLNEGLSFREIIQNYYPDLQIEDIRAALKYAIALISSEEISLISA